jgi:ABC-type Na+ efflux pump permease subunit
VKLLFEGWTQWITNLEFLGSMRVIVAPTMAVMTGLAIISYVRIKAKHKNQLQYAGVNMGEVLLQMYDKYNKAIFIIVMDKHTPNRYTREEVKKAKEIANGMVKEYNWYYGEALKFGRHQIPPHLPNFISSWQEVVGIKRI